jgi:predicted branched-subunit amino acid permease/branched-subunit amino acid transport protein
MSAIKIFERFYHKKCYKALFSGPAVEYNRQCLEQERSNFNMETSNSLLDADIIREQKPVWAFSRKVFCEGIRDGVPIALGYFAVSFSLGIAARKAGFTPFQGFLASLLNNASAGEYAAFALIMSGASYFQVAVITLIANARYLLMSCALAQRFAPGTPFWHRLLIGYDVTDELFGITIARPGSLNPCYTYGAILLAAPAWASGTALGIVAGNLLPLRAVSALSVALYGMFLAIIIPPARKDKVVVVLVAISFALSFACNYLPGISALSDGTRTRIRRRNMTHNNYIYIAVMALVSYAIRILPLTLIRKPIKNRFVQSFLYYVPYVTLAVMTFPAIVQATQSPVAGAVALVIGIAAAWCGASLFQVAVACCAVVFVLEFFL